MLLALTLLLSLAAIDVESSCTFKYTNKFDLPNCFFLPDCRYGHELAPGYNTYKRVHTSGTYKYYGANYKKLTVNVGGHILFGHGPLAPIYPYYSSSLKKPKCQRYDLIGVYWAATDTRYCGKVCYGETRTQYERIKFTNLVYQAFQGTSGFNGFGPTHLFIVTWLNVDSLYKPCCRSTKRDTEERIDERRGKKGNKPKPNAEDDEGEFDDEELDKAYAEAAELEDAVKVKGKLKEDAGDRETPDGEAADSDERPDVEEPKEASSKTVWHHGLNSYQIVLGTNGVQTYAALIYTTEYILWRDHESRQMAGFWTNYTPTKMTYAFQWSWNYFLYLLKHFGNPNPSGGCATYMFRLDPFSWPFIRDPKWWMTKYGYRTCY